MRRCVFLLVLGALLGAQAVSTAVLLDAHWSTGGYCHGTEDGCDAGCLACPACSVHAPAEPASAATAPGLVPLTAAPGPDERQPVAGAGVEILHIPKPALV